MEDTSKYLIHAKMTADGIVERNDVVGAVFGQTEGLLGDEFDLRELQQSSKVGRIDVRVESEGGQSFGDVTIASSLDKIETAILAASLETISRVGPCQARVEVKNIEDVRAAKRRIVVERAKELLANSFEESVLTSDELHEEVRESVRAGDITEYDGLPAGPNVAASDAIVVVEGRADVLRLLKYGIKNAIAVEGTNVPDVVADLTEGRTVTAFLDGDRGGELILRELDQVGDVDYVAFAPEGRSVEDLSHAEVLSALREKTPFEVYAEARATADAETARSVAATDGSATPAPEGDDDHPRTASPASTETPPTHADDETPVNRSTDYRATLAESIRESLEADPDVVEPTNTGEDASVAVEPEGVSDGEPVVPESTDVESGDPEAVDVEAADADAAEADPGSEVADVPDDEPIAESDEQAVEPSLGAHVREVVGGSTRDARLLDPEFGIVADCDVGEAFETIEESGGSYALVFDGELPQRVLDVAAQHGLEHVVTRETGEFVKQPATPHVRLADGFLD